MTACSCCLGNHVCRACSRMQVKAQRRLALGRPQVAELLRLNGDGSSVGTATAIDDSIEQLALREHDGARCTGCSAPHIVLRKACRAVPPGLRSCPQARALPQ